MNSKEFEKRRNSIWAKYERKYGSPIVEEIRDHAEKIVGLSGDDDVTLNDLDGYLSSNIPIWKDILLHKHGSSAAGDSTEAKLRKRYRKCFERRFYLVNFVKDRPYKRGTRIDWKRMVTDWNKLHSSNPVPLSTFRVEYQRAIKEDTLMLQVYIIRGNQILNKLWEPLEKKLRDMANNNPYSFFLTCLLGQKLWNDSQPFVLSLDENVKNSPMFKEIEAQWGSEVTARLKSFLNPPNRLDELVGELSKLADKRLHDLEAKRRETRQRRREIAHDQKR